jgi:hypothetical protein
LIFANRNLHLIDVENLARHGNPPIDVLSTAFRLYDRAVRPGPRDHTIIGCDRGLITKVWWVRPGALLRSGKGQHGGENAVLDAVEPEDVAARFPQVIIGSGDHAFTKLAEELRSRGTSIGVVGHRGSIARELGAAATWVRYMDPLNEGPTVA